MHSETSTSLPLSPSDEQLWADLDEADRLGDKELAQHIASMLRQRGVKAEAPAAASKAPAENPFAKVGRAVAAGAPEAGRAAVAGVSDFATNVAGLPGELARAAPGLSYKGIPLSAPLGTGDEIRESIGKLTGRDLPRPKTDAGQYSAKGIEGMLSMLAFGVPRTAMPLILGGVSGLAGEGAARAAPDQPLARAGGNPAGLAPGIAWDALSGAGRPMKYAAAYILSRLMNAPGGVPYVAGRAASSLAGGKESALKDIARALMSTELQNQPMNFGPLGP